MNYTNNVRSNGFKPIERKLFRYMIRQIDYRNIDEWGNFEWVKPFDEIVGAFKDKYNVPNALVNYYFNKWVGVTLSTVNDGKCEMYTMTYEDFEDNDELWHYDYRKTRMQFTKEFIEITFLQAKHMLFTIILDDHKNDLFAAYASIVPSRVLSNYWKYAGNKN